MSGKHDRIVPAASAKALVSQIPNAVFNFYDYGHTGLMVKTSVKKTVWIPFEKWLNG
jgi:poly(3-hydroxyalkanoate) synthetase